MSPRRGQHNSERVSAWQESFAFVLNAGFEGFLIQIRIETNGFHISHGKQRNMSDSEAIIRVVIPSVMPLTVTVNLNLVVSSYQAAKYTTRWTRRLTL